MSGVGYVWCFSHGRMHDFTETDPWCTASWVALGTNYKAVAEDRKRQHFGEARFMDELQLEAQVAVIEQVREREEAA